MALARIDFFSETLLRSVTCDVILPQKSYNQVCEGTQPADNTKIPVLWLLHGSSDDETSWLRRTSIERYVSSLGLAVVMPSVNHSGYCNEVHGEMFFDYITTELQNTMHKYFGFSLDREDNFVCGLSMGGWGALKVGLYYPDRYAAVGCLSAGIFDYPLPEDTTKLDPVTSRSKYIHYDSRNLRGSEEDITGNAEKLVENGGPFPKIYHSTGDHDHVLKWAHFTRDFFTKFEGNPFGYVYEEDPGKHTWEYWDAHIVKFLEYLKTNNLLKA